ncbi:hypothetical protein CDD83_556 [Cordyceps sp. RAO-2017]|nr:hypothetical protein CDD83_556 [Cordyceps sp. RAO-2017]
MAFRPKRESVETEFYLSDVEEDATNLDIVDANIQAVLNSRFAIGLEYFAIKDAKSVPIPDPGTNPDFLLHNLETGQPGVVVIQALEAALHRHRLDWIQKRKLFQILDWRFQCHACKVFKKPFDYERGNFIFWGPDFPPRPFLRCGPCIRCVQNCASRLEFDPYESDLVIKQCTPRD